MSDGIRMNYRYGKRVKAVSKYTKKELEEQIASLRAVVAKVSSIDRDFVGLQHGLKVATESLEEARTQRDTARAQLRAQDEIAKNGKSAQEDALLTKTETRQIILVLAQAVKYNAKKAYKFT